MISTTTNPVRTKGGERVAVWAPCSPQGVEIAISGSQVGRFEHNLQRGTSDCHFFNTVLEETLDDGVPGERLGQVAAGGMARELLFDRGPDGLGGVGEEDALDPREMVG